MITRVSVASPAGSRGNNATGQGPMRARSGSLVVPAQRYRSPEDPRAHSFSSALLTTCDDASTGVGWDLVGPHGRAAW